MEIISSAYTQDIKFSSCLHIHIHNRNYIAPKTVFTFNLNFEYEIHSGPSQTVWTYVLTNRATTIGYTFELILEPNRWKVRAQLKLLLECCAYFNNLPTKKRRKIVFHSHTQKQQCTHVFPKDQQKKNNNSVYRLISAVCVCEKILFVRLPFIVLRCVCAYYILLPNTIFSTFM